VRLLVLHARGRRAGPIAGAVVAVAVACWALAAFAPDAGMVVAVAGSLALVSLLGLGLGGDDPGLERTTPRPWARWRAAELGVAAAIAAAAVRNLAGLGGLAALGAVLAGPRLAWCAPAAWAFAGSAIGPRSEDWLAPLTWPVQAGNASIALALASALALTGAALHATLGARRV
jgi:hypothetical protein